ncbi:MAG: hypothetical protein GY853_06585 [PVC group bacterium]|nr:hypothetical protein [PVC group bacterium]
MKLELVEMTSVSFFKEHGQEFLFYWTLEKDHIYLESIRYKSEEKATLALISNNIEWEVVDLNYDKFVGCG